MIIDAQGQIEPRLRAEMLAHGENELGPEIPCGVAGLIIYFAGYDILFHGFVERAGLDTQRVILIQQHISPRPDRNDKPVPELVIIRLGSQVVLELLIDEPAFPTEVQDRSKNAVERPRAKRQVMLVDATESMCMDIGPEKFVKKPFALHLLVKAVG